MFILRYNFISRTGFKPQPDFSRTLRVSGDLSPKGVRFFVRFILD